MPTPFSENLSARRAALSLSPEALAGKLRVPVKTLSRWESGRAFPPLAKLPLLAKALDCPLDGLLAGTPAEAAALLVGRAQREKRAAVLKASGVFSFVLALVSALTLLPQIAAGFMLASFAVSEEASIGIIGGADGPAAILVSKNLSPDGWLWIAVPLLLLAAGIALLLIGRKLQKTA